MVDPEIGPFISGRYYRVIRSSEVNIIKNEILQYIKSGYSRYDSSMVYEFEDENGITKELLLHDEKDPDIW